MRASCIVQMKHNSYNVAMRFTLSESYDARAITKRVLWELFANFTIFAVARFVVGCYRFLLRKHPGEKIYKID